MMLYLLLLPAFLWGLSDLKSDQFVFDGKTAHLQGHVILNHPMGHIEAESADLEVDPKKTKGPFSRIVLNGHVKIQRDLSEILASHADIQCLQEEGMFVGDDKVHFKHLLKNKTLIVTSKQAFIGFNPTGFKWLKGQGDVVIDYDEYYKGKSPELHVQALQEGSYEITLLPEAELHAKTGEVLKGKTMRWLTESEEIEVEKPTGTLQNGSIDFEGDKLTWNSQTAVLKGNVQIRLKDQGTWVTKNTVRLMRNEKGEWYSADAQGPVFFTRVANDRDKSFSLQGFGPAHADLINHKIRFTSISEDKPVQLSDQMGEAFGETLELYYDGKELKKIVLEGSVYLSHTINGSVERSYAKGDRLTYDPKTQISTLESDKGRVFIFDKVNQTEVSAPKIILERDPVTKKDTIKGEGDVRFHLVDQEFQELKNRFKLEDKAHEPAQS